MPAAQTPPWQVGDTARLKKPHACGSADWLVLRMGMDVRLQCLGCGRELKLARRDFEKALKARLPANAEDSQ